MAMEIDLFDVQAGFGGAAPGAAGAFSPEALAAELARHRIGRALVRITPEGLDTDVERSNARLADACRAHPELVPCPVVVPATGYDLAPEAEQADTAVRAGAAAVVIRPGPDSWMIADWLSDRLFRALADRHLPVVCLLRLVPIDQVAALARRFPALPVILAEVHYRQQQVLLPLLEAFPNVYLSTGNNYIVSGGIEQAVATVGAERLLFGTGLPDSEAAGAISYLAYAKVSGEERQLIGAGNMRRLAGAIR